MGGLLHLVQRGGAWAGTIRYIAYEFLLAFHSNYGAILYRLRDIASYWSKIAKMFTPNLYLSPTGGDFVGISRRYFILAKLENYCMVKKL